MSREEQGILGGGSLTNPSMIFFVLYWLAGLDFLVDENKKCLLLEANPEPSLGMFGKSKEEIMGEGDPLGGGGGVGRQRICEVL